MFNYPNEKSVKNKLKTCKYEFGFLSLHQNRSMFINISTWVTLKNDENWSRDLSKLNKEIKRYLFNNLNSSKFDKFFISDMECRETGFKQGITIYVDFEITLFAKSTKFFEFSKELRMEVESHINYIIENILVDDENFSFSLK